MRGFGPIGLRRAVAQFEFRLSNPPETFLAAPSDDRPRPEADILIDRRRGCGIGASRTADQGRDPDLSVGVDVFRFFAYGPAARRSSSDGPHSTGRRKSRRTAAAPP